MPDARGKIHTRIHPVIGAGPSGAMLRPLSESNRTWKASNPMRQLSPAGQQLVSDLAQRHGFSRDAVLSMLESLIRGNGVMAQFNHPEFGGSGQWMRGGMIMVSDMFNNLLKGRIDGLCGELSELVASQPDLMTPGSFQSQTQGHRQGRDVGLGEQQQDRFGPLKGVSLFVSSEGSGDWWPLRLGRPNSAGAQNGVRYAYFAAARRLAIELSGTVTVYDTLDHQITGFSQQQSRGGSLTFSSQHGLVDVASLPVVPITGSASQERAPRASSPAPPAPATHELDIVATIEKLAELHRKGILSDEEFAAKKAELLSRL